MTGLSQASKALFIIPLIQNRLAPAVRKKDFPSRQLVLRSGIQIGRVMSPSRPPAPRA